MFYRFMRHWPLHRSIYHKVIQSGCSLCSFTVYVVFLFFQVILSSKSWKGFQNFSSLSVRQVLDVMFKSRADATAKTYIRVIKKFMDWCKSRQIRMQLPFPLGVVSLCLLEVQQSCTSSSLAGLQAFTLLRQLRSSSKDLLSIPHFNLKTYGARSFSVAAPTLWNTLPSDIKNSSSVSLFKHKLKTFLFKKAFL